MPETKRDKLVKESEEEARRESFEEITSSTEKSQNENNKIQEVINEVLDGPISKLAKRLGETVAKRIPQTYRTIFSDFGYELISTIENGKPVYMIRSATITKLSLPQLGALASELVFHTINELFTSKK